MSVDDARHALKHAITVLRNKYAAFVVCDQLRPYIRASVDASGAIAAARAARLAAGGAGGESKQPPAAIVPGAGGVNGSPGHGPVRGSLASPMRPRANTTDGSLFDEKSDAATPQAAGKSSGRGDGAGAHNPPLQLLSTLPFELKTASEQGLLSVVINDFPLVWPAVKDQYISYELIALRVGKVKHPTHFGENSGVFAQSRRLVLNYAGIRDLANKIAVEAKAEHVARMLPPPMTLESGACCGDGWEWSHTKDMSQWLAKIQAEGSPAIQKALANGTLAPDDDIQDQNCFHSALDHTLRSVFRAHLNGTATHTGDEVVIFHPSLLFAEIPPTTESDYVLMMCMNVVQQLYVLPTARELGRCCKVSRRKTMAEEFYTLAASMVERLWGDSMGKTIADARSGLRKLLSDGGEDWANKAFTPAVDEVLRAVEIEMSGGVEHFVATNGTTGGGPIPPSPHGDNGPETSANRSSVVGRTFSIAGMGGRFGSSGTQPVTSSPNPRASVHAGSGLPPKHGAGGSKINLLSASTTGTTPTVVGGMAGGIGSAVRRPSVMAASKYSVGRDSGSGVEGSVASSASPGVMRAVSTAAGIAAAAPAVDLNSLNTPIAENEKDNAAAAASAAAAAAAAGERTITFHVSDDDAIRAGTTPSPPALGAAPPTNATILSTLTASNTNQPPAHGSPATSAGIIIPAPLFGTAPPSPSIPTVPASPGAVAGRTTPPIPIAGSASPAAATGTIRSDSPAPPSASGSAATDWRAYKMRALPVNRRLGAAVSQYKFMWTETGRGFADQLLDPASSKDALFDLTRRLVSEFTSAISKVIVPAVYRMHLAFRPKPVRANANTTNGPAVTGGAVLPSPPALNGRPPSPAITQHPSTPSGVTPASPTAETPATAAPSAPVIPPPHARCPSLIAYIDASCSSTAMDDCIVAYLKHTGMPGPLLSVLAPFFRVVKTLETNMSRVLNQPVAINKLIDDAGDELWQVLGSAHSVSRGKGLDGKDLPSDSELAIGVSLSSEMRGIQRRLLNELTGAGDGDGVGRSLRKQSLHRMCDGLFEAHIRGLNAGRVRLCMELKHAILHGQSKPATPDALRQCVATVLAAAVCEFGQKCLHDSWIVVCDGIMDYTRTLMLEKIHDDVFPVLFAGAEDTNAASNAGANTTAIGVDNLPASSGITEKLKQRLPSQLSGVIDARTFVSGVLDTVVTTRVQQLLRPRLAYLEGVLFRQSNTELIERNKSNLKRAVGAHLQQTGVRPGPASPADLTSILGSGH